MTRAVVIGAGMTPFGKHLGAKIGPLGAAAVSAALSSAGLGIAGIQAATCGNVLGGMLPGQRILREFGVSDIPIVNVENACSSGGTALHLATRMIESGEYDIVLAVGVEILSVLGSGVLPLDPDDTEVLQGINMPASYAMRAQRYMHEYKLTPEQLALVSVKSHENGARNPYAQFSTPWTVEDVVNAKMIADPLTLYMCCPNSDGAAAVVVCSDRVAPRYTTRPVYVRASELVSGHFRPVRDLTAPETTITARDKAFAAAGVGPADLDMIECHDAFAIGELFYYEIFGLAEKGEGAGLLTSGATKIDGRIPVNPSGGLLARGHPLGATGVAQVAEAFWQLRGEAEGRQITNPRVALTHVTGGGISGYDNGACTVHILTT
jgi:benzoylsuccinyl-CoA thiolase BbsB subunit